MSPVSPIIIRSVNFSSVAEFLAFRFRSGPRTITPYAYRADGIPVSFGAIVTLAASPTILFVEMQWVKRTGGRTYAIVMVFRIGAAANTMLVYDVTLDAWTAEFNGFATGEDDFGSNDIGFMTLTNDAFIYQFGQTTASNFVLRKLSVDLVSTDAKIGSETPIGVPDQLQVAVNTVGTFSTTGGAEIDIDGTVRNPTAYDLLGSSFAAFSTFPVTNFTGEVLAFRASNLVPYQIQISGVDLTWTDRTSGWFPSIQKNVHLNDAGTAFGVMAFVQTSSPPSETFDWIDALPKTAEHASSVKIRPTDFVSDASPGTLDELPDAVFALSASP